jgi:hypothetical protein
MARPRIADVAFAYLLVASPLAAQPCMPFDDVLAASGFCSNIQWLYNRAITLGCTAPPGQTWYCPSEFVRRDQMAAFLNRLANNAVFQQGGNAFGTTATLGTLDNEPVRIEVNGERVASFSPDPISPNVVLGGNNQTLVGVRGASIGGGGADTGSDPAYPVVPNRVAGHYGTVGGGGANTAGDLAAGASARPFATVGGGLLNTASGLVSTVSGGSGNVAAGGYSMVPGGADNEATGSFSAAFGHRAKANGDGAFVWADSSAFDFATNVANNFRVRATGGVRFVVGIDGTGATTWSCGLVNGDPGWVCSSDREQKQDLERLDGEAVLAKLAAMPVYAWSPKGANWHVRHYGPTAQDFHAAFGLGNTDLGIGQQDADGVALAAIQGLNAKLESKIAEQARAIAEQAHEIAELRRVVAMLIARTGPADDAATSPP